MNILAIDTANEYLSLALACNAKIYQQQLAIGNRQSEYILVEIDKLVSAAAISLSQIDLIAYNQGPGSFTGLRIGLSCALGLGYSLNCRLVPIPAFALYTNHLTREYQHLIVALDARLSQVYLAGICQSDGSYSIPPQVVNPEQVASILAANPELNLQNCAFSGSGFTVYRDKFQELLEHGYPLLQQGYPDPANMLGLAESGNYPSVTAFEAELIYIRNKVALDINEQLQSRSQAC